MGVRARAGRSAKRHFSSTEWNPGAWAEGQQRRSAAQAPAGGVEAGVRAHWRERGGGGAEVGAGSLMHCETRARAAR